MNATFEKLRQLTAKQFTLSADKISEQDDVFATLHINSLEALRYLTEIETLFEVQIPDYELQKVRSFGDLAKIIDRYKL